ncbi:MAG: GNAT family N-acetyltransferase [bacterium]|jgi:GNAT superfamily N-acetyltransferase
MELKVRRIERQADFENGFTREDFIEFLYTHLGRFGDTRSAIEKAVDYAFSETEGKGGFLVTAHLGDDLVGEVVINDTGMAEYVPEHLLVYIAVHGDYRSKGLGARIMDETFRMCEGNVALHVEYDNPAKRFYERLGMKSKYAEMRYIKQAE